MVDTSIIMGYNPGKEDFNSGYERGLSLKNAARQSQMQDMQFQQQQQDRTLAETRRQQFGQTLGGMVPPELAEFAKADPEGAMKLWEFKKSATKEQRQSFIDSQDMIANVAGNLRAVPQEQRAAAFQQLAPQLLQRGFNEKMLGSVNLTDAGLDGYLSSSVGAVKMMEFDDKAATRKLTERGQAITINGQGITMRGQDMTANSAALARDVTMRGQDISADNSRRTAAGGVKATEGEKTAAFLANRLGGALTDISAVTKSNPGAAGVGFRDMAGVFGDTAKNFAVSGDRQQIIAAQDDALDAALTLGTGAAYNAEQLKSYSRSYFPQNGDTQTTIRGKKERFVRLLESAAIKAGNATPPALVAAIKQGRAELSSAPNAGGRRAAPSNDLRPGMVQDGYRYRGGNKADPKSWVKVNR